MPNTDSILFLKEARLFLPLKTHQKSHVNTQIDFSSRSKGKTIYFKKRGDEIFYHDIPKLLVLNVLKIHTTYKYIYCKILC